MALAAPSVGHHIPLVLLKLPFKHERLAEIHAVGVLQVVHRQLWQVNLRQRRRRRALADVVRGAVVTVVGIHLHGRERVRAQDAVHRRHAVTLVEVFALRRRTAVKATEQARGAGAHIRAAEVVVHVGPCKALVVLALQATRGRAAALHRADGLELVGEHHARQTE